MIGYHIPTKFSAPAYSMRKRTTIEDLAKTPGPGRYDEVGLGTYIDKAPVYSMRQKTPFLASK